MALTEAGVVAGAAAIGLLFGVVLRASGFCTMGAVADAVLTGSFERARTWAMALAVAIMGFQGLVAAGLMQAADSAYAAPTQGLASALLGGLLFGVGMVLASGCAATNLVRLGGGSLKALTVALVLGATAYSAQRGALVDVRVAVGEWARVNLASGADLPSQLAAATGWPVPRAAALAGAAVGLALCAWVWMRPEGRHARVWGWGAALGLLVLAAWVLSGILGRVEEHPLTLERAFLGSRSGRMEALSFVAPVASVVGAAVLGWGQTSPWTLGVASACGVVAGACLHAGATRSFRWEGFAGTGDTARHLVGAVAMGLGGVLALGCTVGQGLSGVSTLSLGSAMALVGIVAGGVMGTRGLAWWMERQG